MFNTYLLCSDKSLLGCGCSSVVEYLASMFEALCSIPREREMKHYHFLNLLELILIVQLLFIFLDRIFCSSARVYFIQLLGSIFILLLQNILLQNIYR
jgi:hypothetical protein